MKLKEHMCLHLIFGKSLFRELTFLRITTRKSVGEGKIGYHERKFIVTPTNHIDLQEKS